MPEPTSAEKNRVVAERWDLFECEIPEHHPRFGLQAPYAHTAYCAPDIPNDPVAADALEKALAAADYEIEICYIRGRWTVDLAPYEGDDWKGMAGSLNKNEALRDAAWEAAMAERSEE